MHEAIQQRRSLHYRDPHCVKITIGNSKSLSAGRGKIHLIIIIQLKRKKDSFFCAICVRLDGFSLPTESILRDCRLRLQTDSVC